MKPDLRAVDVDHFVPPYPEDVRARGFLFELDWELVEQSNTWVLCPLDQRPWLLMIWACAWKSSPCGSWPADDDLIAARVGMPVRQFRAHRDILMRGWKLATDGRLYHDTVTVFVLRMCAKRVKDAQKVRAYRDRQVVKNQALTPNVTGESPVSHRLLTGESPLLTVSDPTITTPHSNKERKTNTPRERGTRSVKPTGVLTLQNLVAEGIPDKAARDWLVVRKSKGMPLTETAWDLVKAEAAKAGITPAEAVAKSASMSWGGFKASWKETDPRAPGATVWPGAENVEDIFARAK